MANFNVDRLLNFPETSPLNMQGSVSAGANALGGGGGGFGGFLEHMKKNPQLMSFALDALGGIVNPSQRGFTPGSDLARSKIAAGKFKERRAGEQGLSPADQQGDTKKTITAGPPGTNYDVETITRTIPKPEQDFANRLSNP